jgi:hypothetical protein
VTQVLQLAAAKRPPSREVVLKSQGIPLEAELPERITELIDRALEMYGELADPRCLYAEIDRYEFAPIYNGEGQNEPHAPLEAIYPLADRLALFAATIGEEVSGKIGELFRENEPAMGFMLDAIASERAELAAVMVADHYLEALLDGGAALSPTAILAYSPGYCGWHITAQRKLFARLQPELIGITLNDSCLMRPLKSISGVLVAGRRSIHEFDNDYDFCDGCETHGCRDRIASIAASR